MAIKKAFREKIKGDNRFKLLYTRLKLLKVKSVVNDATVVMLLDESINDCFYSAAIKEKKKYGS